MQSTHQISSIIWHEESDDDLTARVARCHGYDVYGEMLGQSSWMETVYLLFRGELPSREALALLEILAVALANPGPREPSVVSAMTSGVVRTPAASWLVAALATGAGRHGGARDVQECMQALHARGLSTQAWVDALRPREGDSIWPCSDYPAGFASAGPSTGPLVRQLLEALLRCATSQGTAVQSLSWLREQWAELGSAASVYGWSMSFALVSACAFSDLGFAPEEGELLYLLLRLPGAAAHALEQSKKSHLQFPFPGLEHTSQQHQEDA